MFLLRYIFIIIILTTLSYIQCAYTQESNRLLDSGTEITIDYLPENDFFYIHTMDKGITLYSLAQVFQVPLEILLKKNNLDPETPTNAGKIVKIPLNNSQILFTRPQNKKYFILRYSVKKKQTLYSLSRDFNISVSDLKSLNNKSSDTLSEGEILTVGYFISEKTNQETHKTDDHVNKYYLSDVLGYWDKNSTTELLFVLHNKARVGSLMDIHNPMLRRHTKAKVIGKIPQGTYPDDIELILSPKCAKIMGILDTRFKVNIKFEK